MMVHTRKYCLTFSRNDGKVMSRRFWRTFNKKEIGSRFDNYMNRLLYMVDNYNVSFTQRSGYYTHCRFWIKQEGKIETFTADWIEDIKPFKKVNLN